MSGYLDVKCPSRASRGLGLFKAWKKQWCILRPNPMEENSGVIALHSSFGMSSNSTVDLPTGSTVCRTKSRTHQYAFGIFMPGEYRKPHVLLAGQTESETQMWMGKIRKLLSGKKHFGRDILLKNSFEMSIIDNEFSRQCLLHGDHGTLTISSHGLLISQLNQSRTKLFIAWKHFSNIVLASSDNALDRNKICFLSTNRLFSSGAGQLSLVSACAAELVRAVRAGRADAELCAPRDAAKRVSRSEGDLYSWGCHSGDGEPVGIRRSSWYSGPSEVSLDDTDLVMTKEANVVPSGQLLRSVAADDLLPITHAKHHLLSYTHRLSRAHPDISSDRRSCASVASGIYEEILEEKHEKPSNYQFSSTQSTIDSTGLDISMDLEENTYESVAECVYATMRRTGKRYPPPPLPPRSLRNMNELSSPGKLQEEWRCRLDDADTVDGVTRHSSLGSLPRSCSPPSHRQPRTTDTLPKFNKNKSTFSVFRKRIKSDSRFLLKSTKTDNVRLDEKTAIEPKKKRFDFGVTPSKSIDIIKNFRVSKALMRNLRISSTNLAKLGEAKSCECLEVETQAVERVDKRCSKSAESLEGHRFSADELDSSEAGRTEDGQDLSELYSEPSLPQDILELILRGRDDLAELRLRRRQVSESDYMPMSPPGAACAPRPPPCEEHYTIMTSPACVTAVTNIAT